MQGRKGWNDADPQDPEPKTLRLSTQSSEQVRNDKRLRAILIYALHWLRAPSIVVTSTTP
jgi:hypothetical protein